MITSSRRFTEKLFYLCILLFGLGASFHASAKIFSFTRNADNFVDETINTQAVVKFFASGEYSADQTQPFEPRISTGLLATWPSGVAINFARCSLWGARLVLMIIYGLSGYLLFFMALRSNNLSASISFIYSLVIWALLARSPYFDGYIYNLGEYPAALWFGFGVLAIAHDRYLLGAFLMGCATWGCKFIYIVPSAAGLLGLVAGGSRINNYRRIIKVSFCFLLPLLVWMTWIYVKTDFPTLKSWVNSAVSFVLRGNSGMDQNAVIHGLLNRLSSPKLEWSAYSLLRKTWIIVSLFLPIIFTLLAWKTTPRKEKFILLATSLSTLIFAIWYFLFHPYMWIRHIQPGLFLGYGVIMFFSFRFYQKNITAVFSSFLRTHLTVSIGLFFLSSLAAGYFIWKGVQEIRTIPKVPYAENTYFK